VVAVELDRVVFRYDDMTMQFDLAVEAGEGLAIVGPSGGGKSTLLNLIAGFETPDSGRIRIAGVDVTDWPPAERPVTMLFQDHNLFAHLDVAANVGLGVRPDLKLTAEDRDRVSTALARVGLDGLEHRLPAQLSGGERQRVALARSLVRNRPVLLLDEPFAALGPALRRGMLDLVNEIRLDRGFTVLLVTHQPDDAKHGADRTAFLCGGRILRVDSTDRLLRCRDIPELVDYIGDR
jgi:thiamine transport system ATP-binding protein